MSDRFRRLAICSVIVLMHGVLSFALDQTGVLRKQISAEPLQVSLIEQVEPEPELMEVSPRLVSLRPVFIEPPTLDLPNDPPPPSPPQPELAKNAITLPKATSPAAKDPGDQPKLVSEVAYLRPVSPRYPPESRRAREEGLVVLRVLVDKEGRADRIEVHRSSGFPRLDAAACEAVRRALFKPYVEHGVARAALVMIPVEFKGRMRTASNLRH